MRISVLLARTWIEELAARGLSTAPALQAAGLDLEALADPTARLEFSSYERLVGAALEATGDPLLGLSAGARSPQTALSVAGMLFSSCGSLLEVTEMLRRYLPLILDGGEFQVLFGEGWSGVSFEAPSELREHPACTVEMGMSMTCGFIGPYTGGEPATEVSFRHAPRGPVALYEQHFGCPVRFEAPHTSVIAAGSLFSRERVYTDPALQEMLRRRAESLLRDLEAPTRLPGRIRDFVVAQEQPATVTAAELARAFGMSERTLRRRLVDHGTSIRLEVDAALREMACAALGVEGVVIKEVAARLGFAELSGFYRAFRRWTDLTPAAFRAQSHG
jgi:AraC-like DNA-binding protein